MKTAPPPQLKTPTPPSPRERFRVSFGGITKNLGHRIVVYGPGGIGKTTFALNAPGPVAFFDLDDSLSRLQGVGDVKIVEGITDWVSLRLALQGDGWDNIKTVVIDSGTKGEEMAVQNTIETVPHENGHAVTSIEGYGFGKGFQHVFDTFLPLLADLDRHCRAGRNVIIICHDCTTNVPNPAGEDWIRFEPRMQSPNSGKASIRLRLREWADHVLFMGYDVAVSKKGKGKGSGTRTIYTAELPHCMAKSRRTTATIPVTDDTEAIWSTILN